MFPALALAAILHRPEVLVCAVAAEAERQGLDPVVVCALVEVESEWNPRARSGTNDYGLFQINERYHGRIVSVGKNVVVGQGILRTQLDASGGNILHALSRYNTGRVSARGLRYARKVLAVAARARKALEAKVWHYRCSLRLGCMDTWRGLWSVDYDPKRKTSASNGALRRAVDARYWWHTGLSRLTTSGGATTPQFAGMAEW